MHNYNYVIYHKNCPDGFGGYFLLTKTGLVAQSAIIYPDQPSASEVPPNVTDKNVIIIDVAYKMHILEEIIKEAKHVVHIDHHDSIRNNVITLASKYKNKFVSVYDAKESGISLVWKYFIDYLEGYSDRSGKMPKFIKYIKDNDIGAWKLSNTHAFMVSLDVHYKLDPGEDNLYKWDKLFDKREIKKIIHIGNIYLRYQRSLVEDNARRYTLEKFPSEQIYDEHKDIFKKAGQYTVAVYNGSGCPSGTLIGKKILADVNCDFVIMWTLHMDKKEYILSFRSEKVNVGEIAKLFGGGGHILAAACSVAVSKYNITDLFFPVSLGR